MFGTRSPLRERELPLSSDVAEALDQLVGLATSELPLAYNKHEVVEQLILMAGTLPDGTVSPIPKTMYRALYTVYTDRLSTTSVFQAGFKRYEAETEITVVPVTDFFLSQVLSSSDDLVGALDGMTAFDIKQSLPKRVTDRAINPESGEVFEVRSGEIAGVVVFPKDSHFALLKSWLQRRINTTLGVMNGTNKAIVHATAVPISERLGSATQRMGIDMHRAVAGMGMEEDDGVEPI